MPLPATITGVSTSSPEVIGGKHTGVRLSDEIKARETAKSPGGATLYDTGRVTVTATADRQVDVHRQGRNVTVWIKGTIVIGAGGTVAVSNAIPADCRPPAGWDALGPLRLANGDWRGSGDAWVDSTGVVWIMNPSTSGSASNLWMATIPYLVD